GPSRRASFPGGPATDDAPVLADRGVASGARRAARPSGRRGLLRGGGRGAARGSGLPAAGAALVLLLQPLLQRREILQHRRGVHGLAAGELLQRLLPGLAVALGEHGPEFLARGRVAREAALVERALVAGGVAQRLVELELQHVREEVARVRRVARHVVLRARIEELLAARRGRGHALVAGLQVPPGLVVVVGRDRP